MREQTLSLPFYGKVGSISKIEPVYQEDQLKHYLRYEYDATGKEKTAQIVPKRQKNKIASNYYQDVKDYLLTTQSQYNTYQATRLKKKIQPKNLYLDLTISAILSCLGFGLSILSVQTASISWITYVSIMIFAAPGAYFGIKLKEAIEYTKDQKKHKFIKQYKEYQTALNEYNLSLSKRQQPTQYRGLAKTTTNENTLKRTRILEK